MENIRTWLFGIVQNLWGPKLPKCQYEPPNPEDLDDSGILWVAYDVRRSGIEKHWAGF